MPDPHTKAGRSTFKEGFSVKPTGKNYLLSIAIDAYKYCPKLNNCVRDAINFKELLIEKYQFEDEHIFLLHNEKATRAGILAKFKELEMLVTPNDNLVIYFSGHGDTKKDTVGYWIPIEAHPSEEWEFISTYDIKASLDNINSFHTFVIVDACFAGSLFMSYRSTYIGSEDKKSRWGLAASHSREVALDGAAGENSPFTQQLLRILKNNERDISIQKLSAAVIEEVQQITEGKQNPILKPLNVKGDDSGQYVFHLKHPTTVAAPSISMPTIETALPQTAVHQSQSANLVKKSARWIVAVLMSILLLFFLFKWLDSNPTDPVDPIIPTDDSQAPVKPENIDLPQGSQVAYTADFSTWSSNEQEPSNQYGIARPSAGWNMYELEPNSNTWIGGGASLGTTFSEDFILDMWFKVERGYPAINLVLSDAGVDYASTDLYLEIWENTQPTYTIYDSWIKGDFYKSTARQFAERVAIPPAILTNINWNASNHITVMRVGNTLHYYLNNQLIRSFEPTFFELKKLFISTAFPSKVYITNIEIKVSR